MGPPIQTEFRWQKLQPHTKRFRPQVLYGFVTKKMVLYGFVWFCMVLYGFVWFCMVLYGFVWFCMVV